MSVKRLGNKKYEIRGSVPTSTGKYHRYSFRKTFNSINDAREFELKYKESFNAETNTFENHSYTLKEFIDVYDLAKANQLKSSTKQSNTYISKYFESLYDEKIQSLTSGQIKQITDAAFKKGLSEEYVNKMLTYLNKIFNYGLEMGYVQFNPVKRIPKYKRPDKIIDEDDFYTPDEFEQFIQCFPRNKENGEYVCYVIVNLLYFMGCRFGDDDDKIRLNQRKPSKYKGLRRFGPEKNLQRINKFMKERPIFYKNFIQMKENFRFYLRCFYCITKVVILQFNSENRTELARNG